MYKYLHIWCKVSSCDIHHLYYNPFLFSPIFNKRYTSLFFFFFLLTPSLMEDGLAAASSITWLTKIELNHLTVLAKYDLSLFAESPKYFYFV